MAEGINLAYGAPAQQDTSIAPGTGKQPTDGKTRKLSKTEANEIVKEVRECIQDAWDHDRDNRQEATIDLAFLAGNQWPDTVRRQRDAAGRPMLTINRLPQFVRQITNDIRQADLAIKVLPEDDESDPKLAKIYDGLIQQIQYKSSADHVFSAAAEHQAGCGIGWFRIVSDYAAHDTFNQELKIKLIRNPLSVYCDPAAIEPDRSDAMWVAITEMMPRKAYKAKYPDAADVDVDIPTNYGTDRPFFWTTVHDVRICEYWKKIPEQRKIAMMPDQSVLDVTDLTPQMLKMLPPAAKMRESTRFRIEQYIVSGTDVLEGPHEWAGQYIPIVPVIGGEWPLEQRIYRYGAIRFARDPQQLYNYARTAAAETIGQAPKSPFLATAEMIGPYKAMWDNLHIKNTPYLVYKPDPNAPGAKPERQPPPDVPAAFLQEANIASDDMKATTGIYDAALGQRSNETAGVAIRGRQQESDTANYHFIDNLQRSLAYAGRIIIDLIPKIYDNERVLRLVGPDHQEQFVPINKVYYTMDGQSHVMNDLTAGTFDVRVNIGRSYATKRLEAVNSMIDYFKTDPQSLPSVRDLFVKEMDWPGSDEMAKRFRNMVPPGLLADPTDPNAPKPPNPMDDPKVQAQMAIDQGKAQDLQASAQLKAAQAALAQAQAQLANAQMAQVASGIDASQKQLALDIHKVNSDVMIKHATAADELAQSHHDRMMDVHDRASDAHDAAFDKVHKTAQLHQDVATANHDQLMAHLQRQDALNAPQSEPGTASPQATP
ncbi:MAG: hypothetical protein KGP14_08125 [Betaproteobacteria bacterium]|nr:hypothetical protein [Betaproteobacteria bacterium]